jgi:hypothetical protein
MESQRWHKEQKNHNDAELDEKHQNQSSKLFFVDFKEMRRPGFGGIPKNVRRDEIEEGECNADDKSAQEKIPEEDDFFVFHDREHLKTISLF